MAALSDVTPTTAARAGSGPDGAHHRAVLAAHDVHPTASGEHPVPAPAVATPVTGLALPIPSTLWRTDDGGDALGGSSVTPEVERSLRQRRGRGDELPAALAETAGTHLGLDLGGVRIHADSHADGLTRDVQATAFTHGSDIYFRRGAYQPGSASGQHLIAHELAHVAQQRTGLFRTAATRTPTIGRVDDPAEAHADRLAHRLAPALRRQAARTRPQTGTES